MDLSKIFEGAYNGLVKNLVDSIEIKNLTEGDSRQRRRRFASDGKYPQDVNIIASGYGSQDFSGTYRVNVSQHTRTLSNGTVSNINPYSYDLEDQRILHYYTRDGEERYRTMSSANSPDIEFVGEVVAQAHNLLTDQLAENLRRTGYEVSVTKG